MLVTTASPNFRLWKDWKKMKKPEQKLTLKASNVNLSDSRISQVNWSDTQANNLICQNMGKMINIFFDIHDFEEEELCLNCHTEDFAQWL